MYENQSRSATVSKIKLTVVRLSTLMTRGCTFHLQGPQLHHMHTLIMRMKKKTLALKEGFYGRPKSSMGKAPLSNMIF